MATKASSILTVSTLAVVVGAVFGLLPSGVARATTPGRAAYESYGCVNCHGDSGKGSCDLRDANVDFPDDAALRAFIDHPSSVHPGSRMPAYADVIAAADYPALVSHVRALSRAKLARAKPSRAEAASK